MAATNKTKGTSVTIERTAERPAEVRNTRTISITTKIITRANISRPKNSTPETFINATVRSTIAFEALGNIIVPRDTTFPTTAFRTINKNEKDKEYQNYKCKAIKDNGNSSKNNINKRGQFLNHHSKQGQFNKLASLSPTSLVLANTFYVTVHNIKHSSSTSEQAHI